MAGQMCYPGPTPDNLACLPVALLPRRQWVLWRGADRVDPQTGLVKLNKIPIDPQTLANADTTDPTTWGAYQACVDALPVALEGWEQDDPAAYRGGGLGYVFADTDPYTGIDFDRCVDPVTGVICPEVEAQVKALASYTELSVSGTGLHVLLEGVLPPTGRRKGHIEMYSYARFFTMSGWRLDDLPATIEARQPQLDTLWCHLFGPTVGQAVWCLDTQRAIQNPTPYTITAIQTDPVHGTYAFFQEMTTGWPLIRCDVAAMAVPQAPAPVIDDLTLIAKAIAATNGAKVQHLASGQWQADYGSQSEADLGFCCLLAFWTRDPLQLDRLFRTTGLMRPKWDESRGTQTYGARTIAEALARQQEWYGSHHATLVVRPAAPPAAGGHVSGPPAPGGGGGGWAAAPVPVPAPTPAPTPAQVWGTPTQNVIFDFSVGVSDRVLMRRMYSPERFLVEKMIPDGLTILGAPAKSFKSYFALSLAMATVGAGSWCDAFPVEEPGDVVFFALEGNEKQLQSRMRQLNPTWGQKTNPYEIIFFFGMDALPAMRQGHLQQVLEQVVDHYHPRLIIVDPLSYLYRLGRQDDLASATLDLLWPLADMMAKAEVAMVAPEHMRKGSKEDVSFVDQVNGSWVKGAVVHAMLTMKREDQDIIMKTMLRDAASQELVLNLTFDDSQRRAFWGFKGSYATAGASRMDSLKAKATDELRTRRYPMSIPDLIATLNLPNTDQTRSNLRQILHRAEREGDVAILKRGEYHWIGQ